MIQLMNIKNIEATTLSGTKAAAQGEEELFDAESMLENTDFANELMASLSTEEMAMQVKPVEVPASMMIQEPSKLIQLPEAGKADSINPKVFDPSLTRGVEKLIQPATSDAGSVILQPATSDAGSVILQPTTSAGSVILQPATSEVGSVILQPATSDAGSVILQPATSDAGSVIHQAEPELLSSEMSQVMLKTPQVQLGRAPAIDVTPVEVDAQLMIMDDFVAQKNLMIKKPLNTSVYGLPKTQAQPVVLENGLKSTPSVNPVGSADLVVPGKAINAETAKAKTTLNPTTVEPAVNSQQFILNSMIAEQGVSQINTADVKAPVKTFDMSHIKSDNANEVMNQISDYIVQAKAAKEPMVNMRVNHEELGMIDITVKKSVIPGQDAIAINIGAHTLDGKNFFQQNSKDLFTHMSKAGINLTDLKVETPSQTAKNDFDMNGQSSRGGFAQDKQFGSEQNQRRHESARRQDLWDLLKDKEAA
jgi:hypothetical protein